MNAKLPALTAGLVLAGIAVTTPATADVNWSGAGYYLSESAFGFNLVLVSGPYSNEAVCKSALSALSQAEQQQVASCDYYASDPDKSGSSN